MGDGWIFLLAAARDEKSGENNFHCFFNERSNESFTNYVQIREKEIYMEKNLKAA